MRIISGIHKGRRLKPVRGDHIRPTSDRVREAVFSVLAERTEGAKVLDLFAGSGALGIEALSRGAEHAVFVDHHPDSLSLVRSNLELVGESSRATIVKGDVFRICRRLGRDGFSFDIIFADPPYRAGFNHDLLRKIKELDLLADEGLVVYETESDFRFDESVGNLFSIVREKKYGDTKIWFIYQ